MKEGNLQVLSLTYIDGRRSFEYRQENIWRLSKLLIRKWWKSRTLSETFYLPGTLVNNKSSCETLKKIIQALFVRAWGLWEFSCTELMVILENFFLFADYFTLWFCYPKRELDKISVTSHVVIHVNSFTEYVLRHASHEEKCEMW